MHFKDLSNISLNKEEEQGIFLMSPNGKISEVNYNECKSSKTKTKVRKFSNIMQKLSSHQEEEDEGESMEEPEDEDEELMI